MPTLRKRRRSGICLTFVTLEPVPSAPLQPVPCLQGNGSSQALDYRKGGKPPRTGSPRSASGSMKTGAAVAVWGSRGTLARSAEGSGDP